MLTRPTKQDFRNIELMMEAADKLGRVVTLEESLGHGSLSYLLAEDVSEDEAKKLDDAVTGTKQGLEALAASMPATKMENVKKYFQELVGNLPGNGELIKLAIKGDTKGMKKATEKASASMTQVQKARDSFANSVALLGAQLSKTTFAKEANPEMVQKSLSDLANLGEEERGDFPDEKTLRKGIERSFVPSKESKGWFGKAMSWLKGKVGKELDKGVFTDDVLGLSLEELAGMVETVKKADVTGDKGEEGAAEAIAGVEDVLTGEDTEGGEGGGGTVPSPGEAQERPDFDLMQFIKDNYPDFFKKLAGAGVKDDSEAVADVDAAVEAGEVAPEDALEDLADEADLEGAAGKQWKDIAKAVVDVTDDGASAQKILQNLGKVDGFKQILADKGVVFEESFRRRPVHSFSLAALLHEEIGFEDLVKMAGTDELGDEVNKEEVLAQVAKGINDAMEDEIVTDIKGGEEGGGEDTEAVEAEIQDVLGQLEEPLEDAKEDPEELVADLEEPAEELGIDPKEFAKALDDVEVMTGMINDMDLELADVLEQLKVAKEALAAEGEGGGDVAEEVEELVSAVGKGPLSKDDLAMILKQYPKIVGSGEESTKARKIFRGAVNAAAGSTIFEEGFTRHDARLIAERLVNLDNHKDDEFSDPMADHDTGWTTDELVKQRWMRMAGFKGY